MELYKRRNPDVAERPFISWNIREIIKNEVDWRADNDEYTVDRMDEMAARGMSEQEMKKVIGFCVEKTTRACPVDESTLCKIFKEKLDL